MRLKCMVAGVVGLVVGMSNAIAEEPQAKPTLAIARQLEPNSDLERKLGEALQRLAETGASKLSEKTINGLPAFADLILYSSSVESSSDHRYVVLYSMFADLFTILQYDGSGKLGSVLFANGDTLNAEIGRGHVPEDPDYALRAFRQRPKLQRDLVTLLGSDEKNTLRDITSLQNDRQGAKSATLGLLMYLQMINDYVASPCRERFDRYRDSEAFAIRFEGGRSAAQHMIPKGITKISNADTVLLQDDETGRQFALLEVSAAPLCQVKQVKIFFSY